MLERDLEMLKSIYCYNGKGNYYYNDLVNKYGKEIVEEEYRKLEEKYVVIKNVYTDSEGVTYNRLEER